MYMRGRAISPYSPVSTKNFGTPGDRRLARSLSSVGSGLSKPGGRGSRSIKIIKKSLFIKRKTGFFGCFIN